MFDTPWIAVGIALFLWWFSTGAILWVVRVHSARRAGVLSVPLLLAGLWGFWQTLGAPEIGAIYIGFLSALAIWGWIELAFLTGAITGPNGFPCPTDAPLWERFIRAWGTIAYHEMLLVLMGITLVLLSWEAVNPTCAACFSILFLARISAKLNLFFGMPRFNDEFLPGHLSHLPSHFRIARMNWLFPFSVTALSVAVCWCVARAGHAPDPGLQIMYILLASLTALALLEHWLLVLPLPDARLWRWMLPEPKPSPRKSQGEESHGI